MTRAEITRQALTLPEDEQLELAQELWENASPSDEPELAPELKTLLETRRAQAEADPAASLPWDEVKDRILADL